MKHNQIHPSKTQKEEKLEMTPMIDVTFLLLIFFMCTLKFKVLEGRLSAYLPKDAGSNQEQIQPKEKVQIDIHVDEVGQRMNAQGTALYDDPTGKTRVTYAGRQLRYSIGTLQFTDLGNVQQKLESIRANNPEMPAVLQAYGMTILGDVVPVLDRAVAAGFREITFGGAFSDDVR